MKTLDWVKLALKRSELGDSPAMKNLRFVRREADVAVASDGHRLHGAIGLAKVTKPRPEPYVLWQQVVPRPCDTRPVVEVKAGVLARAVRKAQKQSEYTVDVGSSKPRLRHRGVVITYQAGDEFFQIRPEGKERQEEPAAERVPVARAAVGSTGTPCQAQRYMSGYLLDALRGAKPGASVEFQMSDDLYSPLKFTMGARFALVMQYRRSW